MKIAAAIISATAGLFFASGAHAETCRLVSLDTQASAPRQVRIVDEQTNQVIWEGSVRGGQSIQVPVSGNRARYEYMYPGDRGYHSNTGFWCKQGESTNF